ncbi:MAG: alpha/beta hydrolase-fold protein [Bacteroidota bacterium]
MIRTVLLFLSLLFTITNAFAAGKLRIMESLAMPSRILNQEVRFSVCLPESYYETKQSYPVVYLLHGLGDDETSWLEYGRISQYADQATRENEIIPMIFIMPQGYRNYYVNDYKGSFLYMEMFVKELVPYIDSLFRTIPKKGKRAIMGYSMGGFGAFMLPLKHPELFGVSVSLSMSVRTDGQYMTEDAKGWDVQWGRLFGGPGLKDSARITEYYRQNSPFHILDQVPAETFNGLRLYLDNGDKEQTLCRSNEELHIMMHKKNIPHEYRVRNGGHNFEYWCSALPNALSFINDAFESKPYRGDTTLDPVTIPMAEVVMNNLNIGGEKLTIFLPPGYDSTNRNYPVLYFVGDFQSTWKNAIASLAGQEVRDNNICPMVMVFLPAVDSSRLNLLFPLVEKHIRIRKGYRFRAIAGFREGAPIAFSLMINSEQFGSCILSDAIITKEEISALISALNQESMKKTNVFIDAPDKGLFVEGNGNAHMQFRDRDIQHEYRVREGNGGFEWALKGLPEIIQFATKRFHK